MSENLGAPAPGRFETLALAVAISSLFAPSPAFADDSSSCALDYKDELELVGVSGDGSAFALRARHEELESGSCKYPAIDGKKNNGTTLYLCRTGERLKACRHWDVYEFERRQCTAEADAKQRLAAAKKAIADAGVDLGAPVEKATPEALQSALKAKGVVNFAIERRATPAPANENRGVDASVVLQVAGSPDVQVEKVFSGCMSLCQLSIRSTWLGNARSLMVLALEASGGCPAIVSRRTGELAPSPSNRGSTGTR